MKTKYPIIGAIIVLILLVALESTYFPMQDTIMGILLVLLFSCIGATVYLIVHNLLKSIVTKGSTKKQSNRKLQNIDRALEEIESKLDAMTEAGQEDGKITPIWGAGTKKDR